MSAISIRRRVSGANLLTARRFLPRFRRAAAAAPGIVAFFVCLFVAIPAGLSTPADDRQSAPLAADDGFTRETLSDFDAPEPAPFAPAPAAVVDPAAREQDAEAVAHHRRRVQHHPQAAQNPPQTLVVKAAPRRNPVEKIVYWWNGWVIRNFHTKFGTVLLEKIGAES